MKKCIRYLINRFVNKKNKINCTIGLMLSIIASVLVYIHIDKVPASPLYYMPTGNLTIAINKNPNLLFEMDCNIIVNSQILTITFENHQCKTIVKYNKNFEILSVSKEDKYSTWYSALFTAFPIGYFMYYIGYLVSKVFIYFWHKFEDF